MLETRAFEGQEYFRLIITTDIDLTQFVPSNQFIECSMLGGNTVLWNAEILPGSEELGMIYHDFGTGSAAVPAAGLYRIRGKFMIDGKKAYTAYSDWIVGQSYGLSV